jgi:hypothetical protein
MAALAANVFEAEGASRKLVREGTAQGFSLSVEGRVGPGRSNAVVGYFESTGRSGWMDRLCSYLAFAARYAFVVIPAIPRNTKATTKNPAASVIGFINNPPMPLEATHPE